MAVFAPVAVDDWLANADGKFHARVVDGALYTKFSEFDNFLRAVYSDKRVEEIAYSEDDWRVDKLELPN